MSLRKLVLPLIVLLCLLLPAYSIYREYQSSVRGPVAERGILDLRSWNFAKDGNVRLKGEWEFYRGQLLTPDSFRNGAAGDNAPGQAILADVPGTWNSYISGTGDKQSYGFGTYRLRIRVDSLQRMELGIHTDMIRMANRIYINDWEVGSSGAPAKSKDEGEQNNIPYSGFAPVSGDEVDILVQVSNYIYPNGGIASSILLGDQHSINQARDWRVLQDLILSSGFLMPVVYLLLIYWMRREEKALLYLSGFCLSALVYSLTHGEKLLPATVPFINGQYALVLQNLSTFGAYYFLVRYITAGHTGRAHRLFLRTLDVFFALALVLAAFLPGQSLSILGVLILIFTAASVTYSVIFMIRHMKIKQTNVWLEFLGLLSILYVILSNGIAVYGIVDTRMIVTFEMLVFVISQALLVAERFARSFREVKEMSHRLLTLDGLKDEFLANTSHELRTPLHGMINMADSLIEGAAGDLNEKMGRDLSMISALGKRLSLLIEDILDLARLKNGGEMLFRRKAVHLPSTAANVLEVVKHTSGSKNIVFESNWPQDLPLVDADEDRLAQILYNLLGNAVKYTLQGTVRISAARDGEFAIVSVADTGIGIPADKLGDIFESYEQIGTDDSTRIAAGTGLGLSITKRLVELGGGRISVESEPGVGSTFRFSVPLSKESEFQEPATSQPVPMVQPAQPYEAAEAIGTAASTTGTAALEAAPAVVSSTAAMPRERNRGLSDAPGDRERGTVLIVDDDLVNRQVLKNLLSLDGYHVVEAESGEQALAKLLGGTNADLIIADWMMPRMSGLELCRSVRELYSLSELPFLLLTARNRIGDILAGFEAGINDFLGKPVDSGELRARVRTLVQLRKSAQDSVRTEMAFLQAQIKPHFLFNALNTVMAMSQIDSERTTELLQELSRYLRRSFDFDNRERLVPVQSELELIRSYLALEQARFGSRLRIEYDLDDIRHALIPPLCIQPIVENAVRHGVMKKIEGGTVRLVFRDEPEALRFSVHDDGIGMTEAQAEAVLAGQAGSGGVGIINIHRRLLVHYGEGLRVVSEEGRGTTVSFAIPKPPLKVIE